MPSTLPILILAGPTAAGKTALAVRLARRLGSEILNADSLQVYRYMDIGTAKPSIEERSAATHRLIDVADPDEPFDAARYLELARPVVNELHARGKVPIVTGGTGLYIKVLTRGICEGAPSHPGMRQRLQDELQARGLLALHQELLRVDPPLGSKIHPNDRQRILRALEVHRISGVPLSHWQQQHRFNRILYRSVKIFLYRQRDVLYDRIDRRVDNMMRQGLLDEVKKLIAMGFGPELKPMQSLGYRQLCGHLAGKLSLDQAVADIRRETRRYAKRQMTWFRGDPEFMWVDARDEQEATDLIEEELQKALPPGGPALPVP